jgi:hypothetical protein
MKTVLSAKLGKPRGSREPELRPAVKAELLRELEETRQGKNLSPRFSSAEDAIAWLNQPRCK